MSADNFFETAGQARTTLLQSMPGQSIAGRIVSAMNNAPEAAQVSTVAIPADVDITASQDYSVTINGTVCTYTAAAAGETQDNLGAELVSAIGAQGAVARRVSASYAGGTLTVTSRFIALAFTIAVAGDNMGAPAAATPAAGAEDVGPGLLLVGNGNHTDGIPDVGGVLAGSTLADDFIGFSVRSDRMTNATDDGDDPVYKAGVGLPMQKDGELVVEADIAPGDSLYVGTSADERGLLFSAAGAGRLAISSDDVRCVRQLNDGLAVIRILRTAL